MVWFGVVDGDGKPVDFVTPTGEVSECLDGHADVGLEGKSVDGATIYRL